MLQALGQTNIHFWQTLSHTQYDGCIKLHKLQFDHAQKVMQLLQGLLKCIMIKHGTITIRIDTNTNAEIDTDTKYK